jgi:hypothetical protein
MDNRRGRFIVTVESVEKRERVSEDQPQNQDFSGDLENQGDRPESSTESSGQAEATAVSGGSARRRVKRRVNVAEISPRPSFWPLVLAMALVVLLLGTLIHPVVQIIGALLLIGAIIGWLTERR